MVSANPPLFMVAVTPLERAIALVRFMFVCAKRVAPLEAKETLPEPSAALLPSARVPALILVPRE